MRWRASLLLPFLVAAAPYETTGPASWYGAELRGSRTANGERFDPEAMTAAHRTLPLGSWAEVTSLDSGRSVRVRINDRGPYYSTRIIDLSAAAARRLGMSGHGERLVRVRAIEHGDPERSASMTSLRAGSGWTPLPEVRPAAIGEGPYFVQLATFESHRRADALAARFGAFVDEAQGLFRVRIGPLTGARQVNGALARVTASGYPGAIVVR
ncbi:MAG: septal ring lytic transglycosylase RlpA family protein [Sphingomonadaceae bacterium]|nr:septal ring lytic transglycosylase RlpA family protein [Sphingomonadaceae bacterium]